MNRSSCAYLRSSVVHMERGQHSSYPPPLKGRLYSPRKLPLNPSKYPFSYFLSVFIFYSFISKSLLRYKPAHYLAKKAPAPGALQGSSSKALMGSPKRFPAPATGILKPCQGQTRLTLSQFIRAFTAMHNLYFWRPLVLNCGSHTAGPSDRKLNSKAHFWTQW